MTELTPAFAEALVALIGVEAEVAIGAVAIDEPMQIGDDLFKVRYSLSCIKVSSVSSSFLRAHSKRT